ncbi:MAG: hypothetical protein KC636_08615, partial [Myxococcales bacterium]|nr:hypothetical protein [Myxococcales bacterium]
MPTSSAATGSDGSETGEPGSGDFPTSTDAQPPTGTDSDSSTGTATTTDDDGDTDTEDEPYCSNGVIDPGEECDDGLENSSDGACTLSCTKATCGDGLLWTGHETCDDGNDDNSDACVVGCVPASCGDGYLFVGAEECEPGEIDDNGEYACSMTCMWSPLVAAPRLVFLSSVMFYGDLSVHEPSLGDYSLSDFPDGGKTGVLLA